MDHHLPLLRLIQQLEAFAPKTEAACPNVCPSTEALPAERQLLLVRSALPALLRQPWQTMGQTTGQPRKLCILAQADALSALPGLVQSLATSELGERTHLLLITRAPQPELEAAACPLQHLLPISWIDVNGLDDARAALFGYLVAATAFPETTAVARLTPHEADAAAMFRLYQALQDHPQAAAAVLSPESRPVLRLPYAAPATFSPGAIPATFPPSAIPAPIPQGAIPATFSPGAFPAPIPQGAIPQNTAHNPAVFRTWFFTRRGYVPDDADAHHLLHAAQAKHPVVWLGTAAPAALPFCVEGATVRPDGELPAAPRVSVIIPVYNNVSYTTACLDALFAATPEHLIEVIVIDNASSDDTAAQLGRYLGVRVITNAENKGFTPACNQGAAVARGEYVLFLNNDTLPLPGWLEPLLECLDQQPWVGAAGSRLLYPDGRLQEAGAVVHTNARASNHGRHDDPSKPEYMRACPVDYCTGACLMVRRVLLDLLGGFDERYAPAYYEETDLCFALRSLGYEVMCEPLSTIIHFGSTTAGLDPTQGVRRYLEINRQKFLAKWAATLAEHEPFPAADEAVVSCDRALLGRRVRKKPAPAPKAAADCIRIAPPDRNQAGSTDVCWISDFLPRHDVSSSGLRVFELVRLMGAMKRKQNFLYFCHSPRDEQYKRDVWKDARCRFVPMQLQDYLSALAKMKPRQLWITNLWTIEYGAFALALVRALRQIMPWMRIVIDTMDFHAKKHFRSFSVGKDGSELLKAEQFLEIEKALYPLADIVVTVSRAEADDLKRDIPGMPRVGVLPNIVRAHSGVQSPENRRHMVFLGNYDVLHNRDSVSWFAAHILPLVRRHIPDAELHLLGAEAEKHYKDNQPEGLRVRGFAADLHSALAEFRVFVCPMPYGAGMKGKLGSAGANGLPVVTTTIGAEGYALKNGEDCCIADTPEAFAQACVELLRNDALWQQFSGAIKTIVDAANNSGEAQKTLEDLVVSLER